MFSGGVDEFFGGIKQMALANWEQRFNRCLSTSEKAFLDLVVR
jgi:hypothetical protein